MSDKIYLWDGQIFTILPSSFKGELLKSTFGFQINSTSIYFKICLNNTVPGWVGSQASPKYRTMVNVHHNCDSTAFLSRVN